MPPALLPLLLLPLGAAASVVGGRPAVLRSCANISSTAGGGGAFQRWRVRQNPANETEVALHLASDPTACIKTGSGAIWVGPCASNVSNYWVLRKTAGVEGLLLVHAVTAQCASAGCNSQLSLSHCEGRGSCLDNATTSPAGNSSSHPPDCLLRHDPSTGQLRTVSSALCVDGGSAWPLKGCADASSQSLPFCDAKLSNRERARDLASRLSAQELATGVLSMLSYPPRLANGTNVKKNLRMTAGVARLGVPPLLFNEALHGPIAYCLPSGKCPTMWPIHILQSATFNRSLWRSIATQIGKEGRALYNNKLDAANYWGPDGAFLSLHALRRSRSPADAKKSSPQ